MLSFFVNFLFGPCAILTSFQRRPTLFIIVSYHIVITNLSGQVLEIDLTRLGNYTCINSWKSIMLSTRMYQNSF